MFVRGVETVPEVGGFGSCCGDLFGGRRQTFDRDEVEWALLLGVPFVASLFKYLWERSKVGGCRTESTNRVSNVAPGFVAG